MNKTAIIYTMPDCPRCDLVKANLERLGFSIEARDVNGLTSGEFKDTEAMTELAMTDGAVPIVVVDGRVVRDGEIVQGLEKKEEDEQW